LIRKTAVEIVLYCEREGRFLQKEIDRRLRSMVLDPRDRALLAELVLGPVRWRATLDAVLAAYAPRGIESRRPRLVEILRQGAYQLVFLSRVPAHAAIDEAVKLARAAFPDPIPGFVNGLLRAIARGVAPAAAAEPPPPPRRTLEPPSADGAIAFDRDVFPDPERDAAAFLASRWSHPEWLVARWLERFGRADSERLLRANASVPALVLRVNTLRTTREALSARLGARPVGDDAPDSLVLAEPTGPVAELPGFAEGEFAVQGPTAARVAPLLRPAAGKAYLDVGAAPGGKATHLAILAGDAARIVALDPSPERLMRVEESARRLGLRSIETVVADGREAAARFGAIFDGVLVDAPCTNTGTLARRIEARWRLVPDDLATLPRLQGELLSAAALAVKPGGRLVYATCSVEREENEDVVRAFLAARPEFRLDSEETTLPVASERDGGYAAALVGGARPAST